MKKLLIAAMLSLLLTGCGAPEAFETMSDEYRVPDTPTQRPILVQLPENAAVTTVQNDSEGCLYLCEDFSVAVQTLESGDMDETLRSITGYPREKLTVRQTQVGDATQYECVFASAGEGGDQVGRTLILDDGSYHYTLTLLADADEAGKLTETWQKILDSVRLGSTVTVEE